MTSPRWLGFGSCGSCPSCPLAEDTRELGKEELHSLLDGGALPPNERALRFEHINQVRGCIGFHNTLLPFLAAYGGTMGAPTGPSRCS